MGGQGMILVLSDSHGAMYRYYKSISGFLSRADMIIHLGDTVEDAKWLLQRMPATAVLHYVRGNNDYSPGAPYSKLVEYKGKQLYLTHGHTVGAFSIDADPTFALKKIAPVAPDAILYGHTHKPVVIRHGGLLLLNPGSLGRGRGLHMATVATLDVDSSGELSANIFNV